MKYAYIFTKEHIERLLPNIPHTRIGDAIYADDFTWMISSGQKRHCGKFYPIKKYSDTDYAIIRSIGDVNIHTGPLACQFDKRFYKVVTIRHYPKAILWLLRLLRLA